MKITKLTEAQKARFPEFVDKWVKIGLSTEPADFEIATEAALRAYKLCNLDGPMVILRLQSPYAATVGGALAWLFLKEFFGKQVEQQVEQQVRQQVEQQVRQQVWQQVEQQVEQQVRQQVWQQVEQQDFTAAKEGFDNYGINSLWSGWGAYVSFLRDACGWKDAILERFEIDEALMQSCGWTWWHKNVLAISDRPEWIKRDNNGRLHSEEEHAIHYRDGWGFSCWHGIVVPDEWIRNRESLTPELALTWKNIEQRRAACEILGWTHILKKLDAKVIDRNESEYIGTLYEANLPDSGMERFLEVLCGTSRRFTIPVPRDVKTASEANAWSFGLHESEHNPEIRT